MSEIKPHVRNKNIVIDLNKSVYVNKNYMRLGNKPSINGVELVGNKTSSDLNLLTNNQTEYEPVHLDSADRADFLLVLGQDGAPKKRQLGELTSRTMQTLSEIPDDLEVGSYVFLLKEEKENGTN